MRYLTALVQDLCTWGQTPLAAATNPQLASTIAAIDDANRQDPNNLNGQPLAMVQGQRAADGWMNYVPPHAMSCGWRCGPTICADGS